MTRAPANRRSSFPPDHPAAGSRAPRAIVLAVCAFCCALTCALSGCGYNVGGSFPAEVRSVSVPIFETTSFRRGVEFQLTEAVHKEIQQRTHFRLVKDGAADTKLTGRIVDIRKDVVGENSFDDPRELQYTIAIEVTWEDMRTSRILAQQQIPLAPEIVPLVAAGDFAPEVGQSLATATQRAVDDLGRQIVDMMEAPW